ncbi:AraC family transcriptional regulator [Chryseobacterium bernardetii]|uniref:AraC family transcriptional regulator n=1 Tax=Chryseobacterium bernardetii TaxID=1241978 RepID=A0A3G6THA9_9FLAO|nr:AraC family transcriptional regulator [Chryseobacterium bernardetii]AZB25986.1 AraC family transcriptional regulator [Chryseobacterium bernardetii]
MFRLFILLLVSTAELWVAQSTGNVAYHQIRKKYDHQKVNDTTALSYVDLLINLAKKEKNYSELTYAYQDALNFEPSGFRKKLYADSAITSAQHSCNNDLIASAYLERGIVSYFNFKDYQPALHDYIKALSYARRSTSPYVKYNILYHLGVMKSYLGYYDEAVSQFETCSAFFKQEILKNNSPDILYNMRKGYYNSLHQLIYCYQQMGDNDSADHLIEIGKREITQDLDFVQLRSYFLKSKGISEFRKGNYEQSIADLNRALPELFRVNDFAWVSVIYFYLGKNKLAQHQQQESFSFFRKVDSIYQKHLFFFPELTENYKILLKNAPKKSNMDETLSFSNTLHEIEKINEEDRHHLFTQFEVERINIEYASITKRYKDTLAAVMTACVFLLMLTTKAYLEKKPEKTYDVVLAGVGVDIEELKTDVSPPKWTLSAEIRNRIRKNLQKFEDEKEFLKPNLSLKKIAIRVGTNPNYLSAYINTEKGMHFNRYLSELRIQYIAELLAEDPITAHQKTEVLAKLCGIASRSNFLKLFSEIYGMSLQEYQHQCREKFAANDRL